MLRLGRSYEGDDGQGLGFGQIVQARVLRGARAQAIGDDGDGEEHEGATHPAQPACNRMSVNSIRLGHVGLRGLNPAGASGRGASG
jgi:hypothetical protein